MGKRVHTDSGAEGESERRFAALRVRAAALTADFADITRAHEAGELTGGEALERHKEIAAEMRAVADEMRALLHALSDPAESGAS